jgi:hypothetical protein
LTSKYFRIVVINWFERTFGYGPKSWDEETTDFYRLYSKQVKRKNYQFPPSKIRAITRLGLWESLIFPQTFWTSPVSLQKMMGMSFSSSDGHNKIGIPWFVHIKIARICGCSSPYGLLHFPQMENAKI